MTCRSSSPGRSPRRQHVRHPPRGRARDARRRHRSSSSDSRPPRQAATPTATGSWSYATATSRSAPSQAGDELALPAAATARIVAPYAAPRLWLARLDLQQAVETYLAEHGHPIRYRYVPQRWPLSAYQNVYAAEPGSAEMPSAGRPFTTELITRLVTGGVLVAPITLHTGVSSQERHEPPYPERFRVPRHTASLVNAVHEWGGRVIAVGTTVVRALETASQPDGNVAPEAGWTNLVVTAERGLWTIDGLLTGLHEPESSHLEMLTAAAGTRAARAQLRGRARARLPLARVRRQPPHPSLTQ